MPFVITATDSPDAAERRQALRPAHIAFLEAKVTLIVAAGALLDDGGTTPIGSLYIIDVETREDAETFIQADPYMVGSVFGEILIVRWRKGFFDYCSLQRAR